MTNIPNSFQKPQECPELADECRKGLNALDNKRIGLDPFLKNVALLAIQNRFGFTELKPKPMPTAPESLRRYRRMSPLDKRKFLAEPVYKTFFTEGEVFAYCEQASRIYHENQSHKHWLGELRESLKDCPEHVLKIDRRLTEFANIEPYPPQGGKPPEITPEELKEALRNSSVANSKEKFHGTVHKNWQD